MQKLFFLFFSVFLPLLVIAQPVARLDTATQAHHLDIPTGGIYDFFHYKKGKSPKLISAHRGGIGIPGYPENALETFKYVLQHSPAIIECDVRMTADSVLVLLHDETLDRTTTGRGPIAKKLWEEMQQVHLIDEFGTVTDYFPPALIDVLEWAKGKAILSLDVKRGTPYQKVVDLIRETNTGDYAFIITYDIGEAKEVYKIAPEIMQSVTIRNNEELEMFKASGIPNNRIIAFTGTILSPYQHYRRLHKMGILTILGTMGNLDRRGDRIGGQYYRDLTRRGVDIIATDRPVAAGQALLKL